MEKHKRRFIKYKQLKEGCVVMISGLMNINDLRMYVKWWKYLPVIEINQEFCI
jgi:hypothetical protein